MLENLVNNVLMQKGKRVFYWKNGTEIDLVSFVGNSVEKLINVTLTVDDTEVLKRELESLDMAGKKLDVGTKDQVLLTRYNESKQTDGKMDGRATDLMGFLEGQGV